MKKVYLTIDDAPSSDFENKLNFLIEKKINTVFFCLGKNIKQNKGRLISALKSGFIIGNHAYSHPFFSDLSLEKCREEIYKTDMVIEELYNESGVIRKMKFFRFPYLDKGGFNSSREKGIYGLDYTDFWKKEQIQEYLKELGYAQIDFYNLNSVFNKYGIMNDADFYSTFNSFDYAFQNPDDREQSDMWPKDKLLNNLDNLFNNANNVSDIIILHDLEYSLPFFYDAVNYLIDKGADFLPLK
ncbi:MAG TPA: polysaccharide deacetylase family protein [Victivallales bacterium]|nr:polysaccharide deacetylase family protein [Victivallales bacterium]